MGEDFMRPKEVEHTFQLGIDFEAKVQLESNFTTTDFGIKEESDSGLVNYSGVNA